MTGNVFDIMKNIQRNRDHTVSVSFPVFLDISKAHLYVCRTLHLAFFFLLVLLIWPG